MLLDFWATWCAPCVAEMPNVRQVLDDFGKNGDFVVVGISLDEREKPVKTFVEKQKYAWSQIVGGPADKNSIAKQYAVEGIPATFLLDRDGKVIAKDLRGDDLRKKVAQATEKAKTSVAEKDPPMKKTEPPEKAAEKTEHDE